MTNQEIDFMLSESGNPCLTVIISTNRLAPGRIKDRKTTLHAINLAKEILKQKNETIRFDIEYFNQKLDEAFLGIDFNHSLEGTGIYISPHFTKVVRFPFPVVEKIRVDEVFDARDLLYLKQTVTDYAVLSLSQENIRLFNGKGENLKEHINGDFPLIYEDTYEYSKPSRGHSFGSGNVKGFERDKSVVEENRLTAFLRMADKLIDKHTGSQLPLIIAGGNKAIADYMKITSHDEWIIGKVEGSYSNDRNMLLANHAWEKVQEHRANENKKRIAVFRELIGNEMVAIGLEEVYMAAALGKGSELFVEKDLENPGYISGKGLKLHLSQPLKRSNYIYVNDAVEHIIRLTGKAGGKVIFAENDDLKEFSGIAMYLRYNENPK